MSALDSSSSAALMQSEELGASAGAEGIRRYADLWVSPLGNETLAPPPLSMTPPEAELSDQIQVASDGSSASRSSA